MQDQAIRYAGWTPAATDMVIDGKAAYNVMGDWAVAEFTDKGKKEQTDYTYFAVPGTDGVFDFLSDSFTLPTGARHPDLARRWLVECGSVAGQDLFNPLKGSIPARTDVDSSHYTGYLAWDLDQWRDPRTRIVGSLTHGVVADNAWNAEIDTALELYLRDGDPARFAEAVATAYEDSR